MVTNNFALTLQQVYMGYQETDIRVVSNDVYVNTLTIEVYNAGVEIDYSGLSSGTITFVKDDNNIVQGDLTINASNITYTMGTNEIAIPGSVRASIQLYGASGERLTPARFRFYVDADLSSTGATPSTTDLIAIATLNSEFNAHLADTAQVYINVFAPPAPLVACKGDGTDDSVAINAIIQYAKSVNGACIVFPPANYGLASKVVVDGSNISLVGFGMGDIHDATGNIAATRFTWIGAANGTMMELCPHATSLTRIDSCQVSNISFIANDLADYGLVIKSVNNSKFEMLYFNEFDVAGLYVGVDTTGAITEASDSQKNIFSMITGKQRIKDGAVLFLTGGTSVAGKKGNTSYNYFESIQGGIHNGNGITVDDADNNYFTQTRFHVLDNTSTGIGIELRGRNDLISSGAAGNFFMHVGISNKTLAYSIIARGTETYTYPSRENTVLYIDKGNGTKDPVIETDAVLTWSTSLGYQNKFKLKSTVFAASDAGILAALAALTTEPIMICGSNTHIGLLAGDSSSKWNINIETATGDMRLTRQTGTGKVSVPALKYAGLDVSVGANDSGGAGYRILRIPNA